MPILGFGSGDGVSVLGGLGEHKCPRCGENANFSVKAAYRYYHFCYLLSFLAKRDFFVQCDNCLLAKPVEQSAILAHFPSDRIPFIRKKGWLLVLISAAILISHAVIRQEINQRRLAALAENPRANDIYLANLARVEGSGFDPGSIDVARMGGSAWGAMKVLKIQGDRLVLATTLSAYSEKKRLERSLGLTAKFDLDNPIVLTQREIAELLSSGVIYDIQRRAPPRARGASGGAGAGRRPAPGRPAGV
ncbi:MAG: zinc ribbon domain-containing protein [Planctomycetota bacterium]|jgi:hypothetical protein|nr:zinc ribbon domain-containing protein [Planctomycetota bacterium]